MAGCHARSANEDRTEGKMKCISGGFAGRKPMNLAEMISTGISETTLAM
jgi:hypothetical protein